MNLKEYIKPQAIMLNEDFTSKDDAIHKMVAKLYEIGSITSIEDFTQAIYAREEEGITNIGMDGLAIPHGKSDCVKVPSIVSATLKNTISLWNDDGEPEDEVRIIFMFAVSTGEGNVHLKMLSEVSRRLATPNRINNLMKAKTSDEYINTLIDEQKEEEKAPVAQNSSNSSNSGNSAKNTDNNADNNNVASDFSIVAITSCAAGIAHTYMAAEALEREGQRRNITIKVEKQGANGTEDKITKDELANANVVIFACDVGPKGKERFKGLPVIKKGVAAPLHDVKGIFDEAIKKADGFDYSNRGTSDNSSDDDEELTGRVSIRKSILTGISYAVPVIVSGGMVLTLAVLVAQIFHLQDSYNTENGILWMYRKLGGGMLGTLMVPVLAAYISFSMVDKPGLAPGFAAGICAGLVGSGFIGGVVGGFVAGYSIMFLKKYLKGGRSIQGFYSFFVYPVFSVIVTGSLMLFVLGSAIGWLNTEATNFMMGLTGANAMVLGALLGFLVSLDLGGPFNKAAYAFCLAAMANHVYTPYAAFASVKMVSAFTATLSTKIQGKYYTEEERELGNTTWLLGFAGITEGAIPLLLNNPLTVLPSFAIGSMVCGAIVSYFQVALSVPGAGIISMFVLQHNDHYSGVQQSLVWLGAAVIGTLISTALMLIIRPITYKKQIEKQKAKKLAQETA